MKNKILKKIIIMLLLVLIIFLLIVYFIKTINFSKGEGAYTGYQLELKTKTSRSSIGGPIFPYNTTSKKRYNISNNDVFYSPPAGEWLLNYDVENSVIPLSRILEIVELGEDEAKIKIKNNTSHSGNNEEESIYTIKYKEKMKVESNWMVSDGSTSHYEIRIIKKWRK